MSSPEISRIVEKDQRFTDFAGTRNTRHAPSVTAAEMKMSPAVERPVRSLSQPTMAGEKKPARLAKQLTAAMPAAADMPPSSAVGNDQNCDDDARMPAAATLKQTIDAGTLPSVGRIAKPAAAIEHRNGEMQPAFAATVGAHADQRQSQRSRTDTESR